MSPYCSYCGTELEESWNVCPTCGKKLKETESHPYRFQSQVQPNQSTDQVVRNPYRQSRLTSYQKVYTTRAGYNYGSASLICGILGLIIGIFFIGPLLGILAIIFGGIGISRDETAALGAIGLILGIFDFILFFFLWYLLWFPWHWFPW
jgi:hypothetical protein